MAGSASPSHCRASSSTIRPKLAWGCLSSGAAVYYLSENMTTRNETHGLHQPSSTSSARLWAFLQVADVCAKLLRPTSQGRWLNRWLAGVSSVQTLLILGTSSAVDAFLSHTAGHGGLVLGQDVKIAAMSDLGWGATENGFGSVLDGPPLRRFWTLGELQNGRQNLPTKSSFRRALAPRDAGTLGGCVGYDAGLEPRRYASLQ